MELDALKVNHTGLDQTADDLMRIVDAIGGRMQQLDGELGPLRADWIGDAQQAYTVAKQRWDGAIDEMRDLLHATSQQVVRANDEYRAADVRGARSFDL
jgi:WXG100 family type VII secretion target